MASHCLSSAIISQLPDAFWLRQESLSTSPLFSLPSTPCFYLSWSLSCQCSAAGNPSTGRVSPAYLVGWARAASGTPRWKDVRTLAAAGESSSRFLMLQICVCSDPFLCPKLILVSTEDKLSQSNFFLMEFSQAGGSRAPLLQA